MLTPNREYYIFFLQQSIELNGKSDFEWMEVALDQAREAAKNEATITRMQDLAHSMDTGILVPLKYAGSCGLCGTRLKAGERAHWSRSSKQVWCVDCAGGADSSVRGASGHAAGGARNRAADASPSWSSSSQPADNGRHAAWRQLCSYLQRCLEAEAAESLVPLRPRELSVVFAHRGRETRGRDERLDAGPRQTLRKTDVSHTVDDLRLADRGRDRPQSYAQGNPSFRCPDRTETSTCLLKKA